MLVTLLGSVTVASAAGAATTLISPFSRRRRPCRNAPVPMLVTPSGSVTLPSAAQPLNA